MPKEKSCATNEWGDNMENYIWNGPEDSDEEIGELVPMKCDYETEWGIKYSKNGLVSFIEQQLKHESRQNKEDPKNARLWEEKLKVPNGITMSIKKGGSHLRKDQPFLRNDI